MALSQVCAHTGKFHEGGGMNQMTMPSSQMIRNLSPGGLRPTLYHATSQSQKLLNT